MQFANYVWECGSPVLLCGPLLLCLCGKPAVSCDSHMMYCSSPMSYILFQSMWNIYIFNPLSTNDT